MRRFDLPSADDTPRPDRREAPRHAIITPLLEEMAVLRIRMKAVLWRYAQFYRDGNRALEAMLERLCEIERDYTMIGKEHPEQDDEYQTTLVHIVLELKDYDEVRTAIMPMMDRKAHLTRVIRRRTSELLRFRWN